MKALVEQVVLVLLCSVHFTLTSKQDADQTEYAILFDTGSSGTRMEINKFLARGPMLQPSDVIQQSLLPTKSSLEFQTLLQILLKLKLT